MTPAETHTGTDGAILRLYTCATCDGDGDVAYTFSGSDHRGGFTGSCWKDCPTCNGLGLVERCSDCERTFATDVEDFASFVAGQLYTDQDGRCGQCAEARFCADVSAWPSQLKEA